MGGGKSIGFFEAFRLRSAWGARGFSVLGSFWWVLGFFEGFKRLFEGFGIFVGFRVP